MRSVIVAPRPSNQRLPYADPSKSPVTEPFSNTARIVLASSGMASVFLAPMFFSLYWKRTTTAGVYAGMLGGMGVCVVLYVLGWSGFGGVAGIEPYYLGGFLPFVWGLAVSILSCVLGSLLSPRPCPKLVAFYFSAGDAADSV